MFAAQLGVGRRQRSYRHVRKQTHVTRHRPLLVIVVTATALEELLQQSRQDGSDAHIAREPHASPAAAAAAVAGAAAAEHAA